MSIQYSYMSLLLSSSCHCKCSVCHLSGLNNHSEVKQVTFYECHWYTATTTLPLYPFCHTAKFISTEGVKPFSGLLYVIWGHFSVQNITSKVYKNFALFKNLSQISLNIYQFEKINCVPLCMHLIKSIFY